MADTLSKLAKPEGATRDKIRKGRGVGSGLGKTSGKNHMACVRGLGLRRQRHSVELQDTPAVRGMITKVAYLVKCEEI